MERPGGGVSADVPILHGRDLALPPQGELRLAHPRRRAADTAPDRSIRVLSLEPLGRSELGHSESSVQVPPRTTTGSSGTALCADHTEVREQAHAAQDASLRRSLPPTQSAVLHSFSVDAWPSAELAWLVPEEVTQQQLWVQLVDPDCASRTLLRSGVYRVRVV